MSERQQVALSWIAQPSNQVTWGTAAGETYYIKLSGNSRSATLRIANAASLNNSSSLDKSWALSDAALADLYHDRLADRSDRA